MGNLSDFDQFLEQLASTYGIELKTARRLAGEMGVWWNQDHRQWIRQRHLELQAAGKSNQEIYRLLAAELATRPFAAPTMSQRQIRRCLYG